ncbi:class A beta-lactamase [Kineococcus sp. T13]|uniref:class A beta-lactamase n=1 Tax=Kineococcus vitellinus TaxID=2696565 RepID=UPI001412686C|nr:class A beta-lactamase [Kineococcus vitellinus]NAZ75956.1 class A beta-lactamase [Kineococcus vitellinus]
MRRPLTAAALALALAGCGSPTAEPGAGSTAGPPSATSSTATPTGTPAATGTGEAAERFAQLEQRFDARLGLFAVDTGSGEVVTHRADERFAFASTYKALAAAAVLDRTTDAELDGVVTWEAGDLVDHSPVTGDHVATGLPLRAVAEAAITVSDNTAANLLLERLGGPQALEQELRALGDGATEVDSTEPEVNDHVPGETQDTSTPRAMATSLRAYAVGDALEAGDREQLVEWLRANTTGGEQVRAGVPAGWVVGDKTGHAGVYGNQNDIAVVWPAGDRAPWVLTVLTDRTGVDDESDDALLAEATRVVVQQLG